MTAQSFSSLQLKKSVFLVGFMASGKSTVGPVLARMLQLPFVDLDHEIEKVVGCSIGTLIRQKGEAYFRQLEAEFLQRYADGNLAVIALGGGAFTFAENRAAIAAKGISIWLHAPFALCWERIQSDAAVRPLAANEAEARARYDERRTLYQQALYEIVIKPEQSSEMIALQIIQIVNGASP